ncbi:hypothetical protein V8B97DRAFT_1875392 [Scleroderma yunnanense]
MAPILLARNSFPLSTNTTLYIAGFVLVGVLVGGLSLWLLARCYKNRMNKKRNEERGAAFLHVRGVVKEGDGSNQANQPSLPNSFSRENVTASVVLPDRVLTRQLPSSGLFAQSNSVPEWGSCPQPPISPLNIAHFRFSRASVFSTQSQLPPPHGPYSRSSSFSASSTGTGPSHSRPVRQLFEPILPDELPLKRLGDYLAILESFDDGWCLVVRDISRSRRSSLASTIIGLRGKSSNSNLNTDPNQAEVGLVPAWVFVKPMKGLTVERPMRSSSVDALQLGLGAAAPSRDTMISWSNFA